MSDRELEYYSRQIVLAGMGYNAQLKLKNAKACVVGLGGLGSPIATQLAAMGVGHLRLVDRDVVELSNLHRQHLYSLDHLGWPKVEVAATRLQRLNPYITVEPLPVSVNQETAEVLVRDMDVIVDGLDRMNPRYAINRACIQLSVPYVFGGAITTYGNVSTIIPEKTPCLECFSGNLDDATLPTCGVVGVHPSILSVVASIEVAEAVKILLDEPPRLANRLLHCDIEEMVFEELQISRVDECPVCGSKPAGPPMPLKDEVIEETCGRDGKRVFVIAPRKDLEITMTQLQKSLQKQGFNIKIRANLGLTFNSPPHVTASVLQSGVMIVEGINDKKKALDFYHQTIGND